MESAEDKRLFDLVRREVNSGVTNLVLPASVVVSASKEALTEVKRLCKLAGVTKIDVVDDNLIE